MQPQQWRSESVWSGDQPEPGQQWGREEGWRRGGGAHQLWGQGGEAGDFSASAVGARALAGGYRAGLQGYRVGYSNYGRMFQITSASWEIM